MELTDFATDPCVLTALGTSLLISVLIAIMGPKVKHLSGRPADLTAVQAVHSRKTPRLGGVAIFVTFVLTFWCSLFEEASNYAKFLVPTAVLFTAGLLEDLGFYISPKNRILAAMTASVITIVLSGFWLPRLGIPGIDAWMDAWWLGIPLTLLVTAGVTNGFNLIDGVNGLSCLTAITALIALSQIAKAGNYQTMVYLAATVATCVIGFWLVNFPFGFVFLGDAGAYVLGFIISWFGIAVLFNVPSASPWAILLTVYWPVADTLLAIYRRCSRKRTVSAPDRLHVHQMVMRTLEICLLGRKRRHLSNPLTTVILSPFVIAPPIMGVFLWSQNGLAFVAVVCFSGLFVASYALVPKMVGNFRR